MLGLLKIGDASPCVSLHRDLKAVYERLQRVPAAEFPMWCARTLNVAAVARHALN